jgi:hypothetical protein
MYYNYYNRNENNVVLSIQLANGRVVILAQMGYYIFVQMSYYIFVQMGYTLYPRTVVSVN